MKKNVLTSPTRVLPLYKHLNSAYPIPSLWIYIYYSIMWQIRILCNQQFRQRCQDCFKVRRAYESFQLMFHLKGWKSCTLDELRKHIDTVVFDACVAQRQKGSSDRRGGTKCPYTQHVRRLCELIDFFRVYPSNERYITLFKKPRKSRRNSPLQALQTYYYNQADQMIYIL